MSYWFKPKDGTPEDSKACYDRLVAGLKGIRAPKLDKDSDWHNFRVVFARRRETGVWQAPIILCRYRGLSNYGTDQKLGRWAMVIPYHGGSDCEFHYISNYKCGNVKMSEYDPDIDFDRVDVYGPHTYLSLVLSTGTYGPWNEFPGPKGQPKKSLTIAS